MLDTGTSVEVNVFLDLGLSLTISRFVDGHLDLLIVVSHDDGSQRRVFSVDHAVIDGPESVEVQGLFIPVSSRGHLVIRLVTDDVVNVVVANVGENLVQGVLLGVSDVTRHEETLVVVSLDEGVNGLTIGVDSSDND